MARLIEAPFSIYTATGAMLLVYWTGPPRERSLLGQDGGYGLMSVDNTSVYYYKSHQKNVRWLSCRCVVLSPCTLQKSCQIRKVGKKCTDALSKFPIAKTP